MAIQHKKLKHIEEAVSGRVVDVNFERLGCGFEVIKVAVTNGYGLECSGYSSNSGKNLTFVNDELSMDTGLTQEELKAHLDALQDKRVEIASDLKTLADRFDKEVEDVFAKHGFKPAKDAY